ncbi:MAG: hypothetical protein E7134_01870 [Rikenellaceae bacterium]|nr:hypothetical protein [Rikenellaceae bacterium]
MFDFVIYLGKSALCLVALYLIYKVAMSHETLHRLNRLLLLGSLPLSALLPLCHIKVIKEYDPQSTATTIEFNDVVLAEAGIDHLALLRVMVVGLFVVGVVVMVVRLVLSLCSVWRLTRSGSRSTLSKGVTLTVVERIPSPFSWFGHIVASEEDLQQCRQMILAHEMAHIRLGHSWDVLMVDVALCLWWFNPALWLLRRELQSLHEYQADDAVLKEGIDAKTYQMLLIKRAVGSRLHSVANCLNHSNLKKRITMMCKKTSSRWSAAKALLVLPMVALSLTAFATTVYVPREVQDKVIKISLKELPNNDKNEQALENLNGQMSAVVVVDGERKPYEVLNQLDPNSIKSVSVIKNIKHLPPELNITVAEAANGVILIELKGDDAEVATKSKVIEILVDELGDNQQRVSFVVDGKSLRVEELQPLFESWRGKYDTLLINAVGEVRMSWIAKVKEAARAAGIYKIDYNLITDTVVVEM